MAIVRYIKSKVSSWTLYPIGPPGKLYQYRLPIDKDAQQGRDTMNGWTGLTICFGLLVLIPQVRGYARLGCAVFGLAGLRVGGRGAWLASALALASIVWIIGNALQWF